MSAPDDGGPAFPPPHECGYLSQDGMSLRDYFAAKAMQGMLAGVHPIVTDPDPLPKVASVAYLMADAMLKARNA
jgi:hypothetical protein